MRPEQCPKCRCYWFRIEPLEEDGPIPLVTTDAFGQVLSYYGKLVCAQCDDPWLPMPDKPTLKSVG